MTVNFSEELKSLESPRVINLLFFSLYRAFITYNVGETL